MKNAEIWKSFLLKRISRPLNTLIVILYILLQFSVVIPYDVLLFLETQIEENNLHKNISMPLVFSGLKLVNMVSLIRRLPLVIIYVLIGA